MWFKNIQFYRLNDNNQINFDNLQEKLKEFAFKPCARQARESLGWVSPISGLTEELVYENKRCYLLCVRKEQKVIPPSLVREMLEQRVQELQSAQGRKVFRKERQEMKEDILAQLLPQALTRATHTHLYFDLQNGFLAINSSSDSQADSIISLLIDTLAQLGASKLDSETAPAHTMKQWMQSDLPQGLTLTGRYALSDPTGERSVSLRDGETGNDFVNDFLEEGFWINALGIEFTERFSCVVTDQLKVKTIKYHDALIEESKDSGQQEGVNDKAAQTVTDFVLMSQAIGDFYQSLVNWFSLHK